MNLLSKSKQWHDDATALIESTGLINLLERFGEIKFTGSYAYNLMLDSDIDIFLVTEDPSREKADEMAKTLIDSGHWTSLMYCDWPTNDPKGPYFCIKSDFRNYRWKIDIMTVTQKQLQELLPPREIYYHANDEHKEIILKIKSARSKGSYSQDTPTVFIYDAVLKNNVTDVEEFKQYLAKLS